MSGRAHGLNRTSGFSMHVPSMSVSMNRNPQLHFRSVIAFRMHLVANLVAFTVMVVHAYGTGRQSGLQAADAPQTGVKSDAADVTLYDADPAHLWNRLHAALFVRIAADGTRYGEDDLDPLLWPKSKHLSTGDHHKHVIEVLDQFLANDGHTLIKDPLKRVILQHDLWAVFDWLANPTNVYRYRDDDTPPQARALQLRLAKVIRRLALPAEEIQRLPDNYAEAVTTKTFPTLHDPDNPEQALLPAKLLDPSGRWVMLGEHMSPAAPVHVRTMQARSAFFVLINLPAGRETTLAYLEQLDLFANPLLPQPERKAKSQPRSPPRFNPELPQFPVGTQVALLRELLAIDDQGKIRSTRIIESAQIRVYREIPQGDPAHPEKFDHLIGKQDVYEFRISRRELFAGNSGGLHAIGAQDKDILPVLNPGPEDPFELDNPKAPIGFKILSQCAGCHARPGIHSVESFRRSFNQRNPPAHLQSVDRDQQEKAAMGRKWEDYSWGLLQGLMEAK